MNQTASFISARKRLRGTTLIELIITLSIAAILMSIAVPSFQDIIQTNRIASATNEMVRALYLTRSEAINRGADVSICTSSNTEAATPTCGTANWDSGWLIMASDGTLIRVGKPGVSGAGKLTVESNGKVAHTIIYLPSGNLKECNEDNNAIITVSIPPKQRKIIISNVGRIRIDTGT